MDEMIEILRNNFEGHEDTRLMFLNRAPKYGNDDDEVDEIARELIDIFSGELDKYPNPRGGSFSTSLYSVTVHVGMGSSGLGHSRWPEMADAPVGGNLSGPRKRSGGADPGDEVGRQDRLSERRSTARHSI